MIFRRFRLWGSILCENIPRGIRPEDNEAGCLSILEKLSRAAKAFTLGGLRWWQRMLEILVCCRLTDPRGKGVKNCIQLTTW